MQQENGENERATGAVPAEIPLVFDPETDARFAPSPDWNPDVEIRPSCSVSDEAIQRMLRIAHIAKRGMEFSTKRPIVVEPSGQNVLIRFPADTNAPPGYRYRGPTWTTTVTLDATTLEVISVLSDPD